MYKLLSYLSHISYHKGVFKSRYQGPSKALRQRHYKLHWRLLLLGHISKVIIPDESVFNKLD